MFRHLGRVAVSLLVPCVLLMGQLSAEAKAQPPKHSDARRLRPQQESTAGERRLALVIGNDSYQSVSILQNARSDARAFAAVLEQVGFKVMLKLDQGEKGMKAALRTFKGQVRGGDVVVFYYSGHGVQLGGANYLLPVDIRGEDEDQVKDDALSLQRVLDDLQDQKTKFALAIVDACRNNPFKVGGRSIGSRGLAPTTAATGQMVLFSAGTGQEALDRLGKNDPNPNGLFTRVLLKEMCRPGVPVRDVLDNVREEVVKLAQGVGHEQVPALYDQALGRFFFVPGSAPSAAVGTEVVLPPPPTASALVGGLQVAVNAPGSKVYVDGDLKGTASPSSALNVKDLAAGDVQVRVESPGYAAIQQEFSIESGKWTQARLTLRKQSASPQGSEFVLVSAGSFQMGTNATDNDWLVHSRPVHGVTISSPFWMAKTPVTVAQFRDFVDATGYRTEAEKGGGAYVWTGSKWEQKADATWRNPYFVQEEGCPVVCVSWNDAQAYLQWMNGKQSSMTYRLPTEAEWEYACRAGTTGETYSTLDAIAWYNDNSGGHTHPVGQKQPNAFGLYDMLGNVWQWCQDWWGDTYASSSSSQDPQGPMNGQYRVSRGGSWNSFATNVRSANRYSNTPDGRADYLGFRVVAVARTQ